MNGQRSKETALESPSTEDKSIGAALLHIRQSIGTLNDDTGEEVELPGRIEALRELLQHTSKVPVAPIERPDLLEMQADFFKRHGIATDWKPLTPTTPKAKKYAEKFRPKARKEYEMSERDVKLMAWKIADEKVRISGGKEFIFDANNRQLFRNLLWYFAFDNRCPWNLHKGLALIGDVGTGKTLLFEIFSTLLARYFPFSTRRFRIKKSREIMRDYQEAGNPVIDEYKVGNVCFDDTGDEEDQLKIYGNTVPVIELLLKERYDRFKQGSGELTHITSNLDIEGILEKYGERATDRLAQMMTFVTVKGDAKTGLSRRPK